MNSAFGLTRTSVQRNHALIAPDSHVSAPLPGWTGTSGIILISPQMGARFAMFFAQMEAGAESALPSAGMQRFAYVIEGKAEVTSRTGKSMLVPGGYAYFPADASHSIRAAETARLLLFEKPFSPMQDGLKPREVIGRTDAVEAAPFLGDPDAMLKTLLPVEPAFDMAVNLFAFQPGTTLPFAETHVMEHGLLMVEGGGIYRLDDRWYPVGKGDVIWMAPYCPQWFVAAGKTPSAYLYYKDIHRDPLVMK
jgi:(S)-ureidoglycine aminohydrolase